MRATGMSHIRSDRTGGVCIVTMTNGTLMDRILHGEMTLQQVIERLTDSEREKVRLFALGLLAADRTRGETA